MDDLKSSHVDTAVNEEFHSWLETKYGDDKIGAVKSKRGKVHEYLGMILDYTHPGKVKIDMKDYVEKMVVNFLEELNHEDVVNPAMQKLFYIDTNNSPLSPNQAEKFCTFIAKGLFLLKRARLDVNLIIPFLCT